LTRTIHLSRLDRLVGIGGMVGRYDRTYVPPDRPGAAAADHIRNARSRSATANRAGAPRASWRVTQHHPGRHYSKWLTTNGLVETRPGQGAFVVVRLDPLHHHAVRRPRDWTRRRRRGRRIRQGQGQGTITVRVGFPGRDPGSKRQRGPPAPSSGGARKPSERFIEATNIPGGSVAYLRDALDIVQVGYRDSVVVRTPDQDEGTFFKLPDDGRIPVISLMRTGYQASDAGPAPFRVMITVLPADRNQLVINSGDVPSTPPARSVRRLSGPVPAGGPTCDTRCPARRHTVKSDWGARAAAILTMNAQGYGADPPGQPHGAE
jgi:hypothetical protein